MKIKFDVILVTANLVIFQCKGHVGILVRRNRNAVLAWDDRKSAVS